MNKLDPYDEERLTAQSIRAAADGLRLFRESFTADQVYDFSRVIIAAAESPLAKNTILGSMLLFVSGLVLSAYQGHLVSVDRTYGVREGQ